MAEDETSRDRVKSCLRSKKIKLWLPPYSDQQGNAQEEELTRIAKETSKEIFLPEETVSRCVKTLHEHSVERLKKKQQNIVNIKIKCSQKQPSMITIDAHLDATGDELKKMVATKLEYAAIDLVALNTAFPTMLKMISVAYSLGGELIEDSVDITDDVKLICSGRVIENDSSLQTQRVRNNSVILCLVIKKADRKESKEVEEALNEVKKARKGAELLAKVGVNNDSAGRYNIVIEDQSGQSLDIPPEEKRALTIALGLHEKGRAILKRKKYELALLLLLEADKEFQECRSEILSMVDNYAVLCLDIVWCYVCSKNISALPDARNRLEKCEEAFKKTYGESLQRLLAIKGSSGNEIALFVRLYVLQAIVNYHDGNYGKCSQLLKKSQEHANMVIVDQDKATELVKLGLSVREARTALRAKMMDVNLASEWAFKQREENKVLKFQDKEKKRIRRMQKQLGPCQNGDRINIDSYDKLNEMGFEACLVQEALKQANNQVADAIDMINTNPELLRRAAEENKTEKKTKAKKDAMEQLRSMGFDEDAVKGCLHHFSGDVDATTEYLSSLTGEIPSNWIEAFRNANSGEGSSKYTEDELALMHDVAQDVTEKQDDYLDFTLDEEITLIDQYKAMLTSLLHR